MMEVVSPRTAGAKFHPAIGTDLLKKNNVQQFKVWNIQDCATFKISCEVGVGVLSHAKGIALAMRGESCCAACSAIWPAPVQLSRLTRDSTFKIDKGLNWSPLG